MNGINGESHEDMTSFPWSVLCSSKAKWQASRRMRRKHQQHRHEEHRHEHKYISTMMEAREHGEKQTEVEVRINIKIRIKINIKINIKIKIQGKPDCWPYRHRQYMTVTTTELLLYLKYLRCYERRDEARTSLPLMAQADHGCVFRPDTRQAQGRGRQGRSGSPSVSYSLLLSVTAAVSCFSGVVCTEYLLCCDISTFPSCHVRSCQETVYVLAFMNRVRMGQSEALRRLRQAGGPSTLSLLFCWPWLAGGKEEAEELEGQLVDLELKDETGTSREDGEEGEEGEGEMAKPGFDKQTQQSRHKE
ncbi:hypothetical protein TEQG_01502 [Trichophyton equinum CBS 127.97]|uniref:Uncharacterized protein n=1 Tax=Trichophyton equinum (strain ATCC MYA-4606 / CBS 127.97) TaxID=559882 RepID=F2PKP8_TRIEC|nr:hypothetical protein TEQG_01502 [Trichophyton equinum CBS 127.97]